MASVIVRKFLIILTSSYLVVAIKAANNLNSQQTHLTVATTFV